MDFIEKDVGSAPSPSNLLGMWLWVNYNRLVLNLLIGKMEIIIPTLPGCENEYKHFGLLLFITVILIRHHLVTQLNQQQLKSESWN